MLGKGCIENVVCFQEKERMLDGKLVLAKGREQKISHKFCFAVNTGKCGNKKHAAVRRSSWHKDDFCPEWMLSPPSWTVILK